MCILSASGQIHNAQINNKGFLTAFTFFYTTGYRQSQNLSWRQVFKIVAFVIDGIMNMFVNISTSWYLPKVLHNAFIYCSVDETAFYLLSSINHEPSILTMRRETWDALAVQKLIKDKKNGAVMQLFKQSEDTPLLMQYMEYKWTPVESN